MSERMCIQNSMYLFDTTDEGQWFALQKCIQLCNAKLNCFLTDYSNDFLQHYDSGVVLVITSASLTGSE